MPEQHPLIEAITPLVERLNAELIAPADARDDDVALEWEGKPVIAVRLPRVPASASPASAPASASTAPASVPASAPASAAGDPAPASASASSDPASAAAGGAPVDPSGSPAAPGSSTLGSSAPAAAGGAPAAARAGAAGGVGGVQSLLADVAAELGGPLRDLSRHDKQRAVLLLESRGAFEYRKSAEIVAEALGVTRFTVYNYLNRSR